MAAQAIFISENWLKTNTPLPSNLDVKKIYPFYKLVQDKHVRDALGDALYNTLCSHLIADTLTADEVSLLELIRPTMAYYMVFEALPWIDTAVNNIGVVSMADDKQTKSSDGNLNRLRNDARNNAEYYMQRVKRYLCNNSALYPDYNATNLDVNPSQQTPYRSGLYVDRGGPEYNIRPDEAWIKKYWD